MDGFGEIGVFTRVVAARSFSKAARSLGLTPSGVSRVIARLERRLGVRLLHRTTRSLSLTDDGTAYYERCTRILAELEDAEATLAHGTRAPRGRLRVDAPTILGRYLVGPAVPELLAANPELSLDLSVQDHLIDPVAEGVDITLRLAPLRDSELVSRVVGHLRILVAGSPRYLAKHGRPTHPDELAQHALIGHLAGGVVVPWRFRGDREVTPIGRLHTNSADAVREAALAGLGLVRAFDFQLAAELARGRLEVVLADHERPRPLYALYARHRAAAPKVRVFLDWVTALLARR
jgi:DNA-binding transcriptional LysR family regulator